MVNSTQSLLELTRQHDMAQIYINNVSFVCAYPMNSSSEAPNSLVEFIQDIGIPHHIHYDNALELARGKWQKMSLTTKTKIP